MTTLSDSQIASTIAQAFAPLPPAGGGVVPIVTVPEPGRPVTPPATPAAVPGKTVFALRAPITDAAGKTHATLALDRPALHHDIAAQARGGTDDPTAAMIAALSGVPIEAIRTLAIRDSLPIALWLRAARTPPWRLNAISVDDAGQNFSAATTAHVRGRPDVVLSVAVVNGGIAGVTVQTPGAVFHGPATIDLDDPAGTGSGAAIKAVASPYDERSETAADGPQRRTFRLLDPVTVGGDTLTELTLAEPTLETGMMADAVAGMAEKTARMLVHCSGKTLSVVNRLSLRDVARLEAWLDPFWVAGAASLIAPDQNPSPNSGTAA